MEALENYSVRENIAPFAGFLADQVTRGLAGEPLPAVPTSGLTSANGRDNKGFDIVRYFYVYS